MLHEDARFHKWFQAVSQRFNIAFGLGHLILQSKVIVMALSSSTRCVDLKDMRGQWHTINAHIVLVSFNQTVDGF